MTTAGSLEVCPSCGEFVDQLFDDTGFCYECSVPHIGGKVCRRCNSREIDGSHNVCRYCRHEIWLVDNADAIDRHLAGNGLRIGRAIRAVKLESKVFCLRCGGVMNRATRGTAYFCSKPQCRTAHNKLRRLIYVKHIPRAQALELVLEGINGENNRTHPQAALR